MIDDESPVPDAEPSIVAPSGFVEPDIMFIVAPAAYHSVATDEGSAEEPEVGTPDPDLDLDASTREAIAALGDGLNRKLDALTILFDREIRAEATREKVVDRLHAELQEYKQGLLLGILRPVFVDLIQLHDDMGKMLEGRADLEGESARLLAMIRGFRQGVEDILYRQGVEPFVLLDDDAFDPRRQRALSTVPTDDPALNKRVASRLRSGFQAGDKVIRPEMVTVYSHKPKAVGPSNLA